MTEYDEKRLEVLKKVPKHRFEDVPGDGDCFLHAAVVGCDHEVISSIRQQVGDALLDNTAEFALNTMSSVNQVEEMAQRIQRTSEFFEDVAVRAFCVAKKRDLIVVILRGDNTVYDVYVYTSRGLVSSFEDKHAHLWKSAVALDLDRQHYCRFREINEHEERESERRFEVEREERQRQHEHETAKRPRLDADVSFASEKVLAIYW